MEWAAARAWRLMGRELDWHAINDVAEYMQVDDIEIFIDCLLVIDDFTEKLNSTQ